MKSIILLLTLIATLGLNGQNLIENPGFEDGTIPSLPPEYIYNFEENVPFWRNGCDTEPVLNLLLTPDIHTVGASDCWWSAPSNSHTNNLPVNFAGTSRFAYCGYSQDLNLKESVIGTLTQPLTAGTYKISLYGSKIEGKGYCPGGSNTTHNPSDPGANVEVVLRKSANICDGSSAVLWTSSEINSLGTWAFCEGLITIDCSIADEYYDRIEFRIKTAEGVHGIFLDDVVLEKVDLKPVIYGGTNLCIGNPLTFSGNIPSGANSLAHFWEIQECTFNGTLIGQPLHGLWISGNPGTYTFPSTLNLACNKHYRIKLAPNNNISCEWVETTKIIKLNCSPTINQIPDQNICSGSSATFNVTTTNWPIKVYDGSNLIGTYYSNPIVLSPNTTTTYSFVASNKFECENSQTATVEVRECPVSCFEFLEPYNIETINTKYGPMPIIEYCWPNEAIIDGSCSMYENGYHIRVGEIDVQSWNIGFDLYNGWVTSYGQVPSSVNLNNLVSPNNFVLNQVYYIGLTVGQGWNTGTGQLFRFIDDCDKTNEKRSSIIPTNNSLEIYPNPTNGQISLVLDQSTSGNVTIMSLDGKIINDMTFKEKIKLDADLSACENGVYVVRITTNENTITQKIIKK